MPFIGRAEERALLRAGGELAAVKRSEMERASFYVSRSELVVMFNWPLPGMRNNDRLMSAGSLPSISRG